MNEAENNGTGNWLDPNLLVPLAGEIVAIACDVVVPNTEGRTVQIIQTAVYNQREDGVEEWLCGQPFVKLLYWLRLPQVPKPVKLFKVQKKLLTLAD